MAYSYDLYLAGSNALETEPNQFNNRITSNTTSLSFKEFFKFSNIINSVNKQEAFLKYMKYGGMPETLMIMENSYLYTNTIKGIYHTIILNKIIRQYKLIDISLIEKVMEYLMNNMGKLISAKQIVDYLVKNKTNVSPHTMITYLKLLENASLIYKVSRYDMIHKKVLKTLDKYYIADVGIRNAIVEFKETDYNCILENIVYFELVRRGYTVTIGKLRKENPYDIDFIAENEHEKKYYQIALTLLDKSIKKRKVLPLKAVSNNYESTILTLDTELCRIPVQGIECKNIVDFLLEE